MKVTCLSKTPKIITVSEMPCNSFAVVHELSGGTSWRVGDLIYRPVSITNHFVSNMRDDTHADKHCSHKVIPVTIEEVIFKYKD